MVILMVVVVVIVIVRAMVGIKHKKASENMREHSHQVQQFGHPPSGDIDRDDGLCATQETSSVTLLMVMVMVVVVTLTVMVMVMVMVMV
jgi:hypothetical protein